MNVELEAQKVLAELAAGRASTAEATVVAIDFPNRLAQVNIGGITKFVRWMGPSPLPNARVRVVSAGGRSYCLPAGGSARGTVQSVAAPYVTVLGDDGVRYQWPYLSGYSPAGGHRVILDHLHQTVIGQLTTDTTAPVNEAAPPTYTPPSAPPKVTVKSAWFAPAWSGNWRFGAYAGSAVEISTTRTGAYGYGRQIDNTIPDSATILICRLQLVQNWDNVPGVNSSLGLHGFAARPGSFGDGNLSDALSVPGGTRTVSLPASFANALRSGTAFGIGFRSGNNGYRQYAAAPGSGRIYMEWSV
jgi:hypothetical protein